MQYLQNFYREKSVVLGIKVKQLSVDSNCRHTSSCTCSLPSTSTNDFSEFNLSYEQRSKLSWESYQISDNQKRTLDQAPENKLDEPAKHPSVNMELETEICFSEEGDNNVNIRIKKQITSDPKENTLRCRESNIRNKKGKGDSMLQKYRGKYEWMKQNESNEQRENRLRKCREHSIKTNGKQTESNEQRENRLSKYRERRIKTKLTKRKEQREDRLRECREQKRKTRETETKQQRENRLRKCREQVTNRKETESKEQREKRSRKCREQKKAKRQSEKILRKYGKQRIKERIG